MMTSDHFSGSLSKDQVDFYNTEGYLVLPELLTQADMAQAVEAMTAKVSAIADELLQAGLITDPLVERPFKYRLAELFQDLTSEHFLQYGRS